jgi:hypothetical protein
MVELKTNPREDILILVQVYDDFLFLPLPLLPFTWGSVLVLVSI